MENALSYPPILFAHSSCEETMIHMDLEKLFVCLFGVSSVPSRKAHLNFAYQKRLHHRI